MVSDFINRHIGLSVQDKTQMLEDLGLSSLDELVREIVPDSILFRGENLIEGCDENQALKELKEIASHNKVKRSLIGQGYYGTITPPVIQRNVLENPAWYTSYTPYQAEISQGRLEALFNYQTLVTELTGLPITNASLLDEGTAAAEAMILAFNTSKKNLFLVDSKVFPQTLKVLQTRAKPLGIKILTVDTSQPLFVEDYMDAFAIIHQFPNNHGQIKYTPNYFKGTKIAIVDPLCQVLMQPVGELGFDIAVGSMQRFGVPMGFGGPHAAFFATTEKYKRKIPGRIVGQSVDSQGNKALRLALQTREQHIRRDKATSNICTAQALLANMAGFYAAYHGAEGLKRIANRILRYRQTLITALKWCGYETDDSEGFDTVRWKSDYQVDGFSIRYENGWNVLSIDERSTLLELASIVSTQVEFENKADTIDHVYDIYKHYHWMSIPQRTKPWLQQTVFNKYQSETNMMRYMHKLASKDYSLVHGMMPLGSCTMKLNAAAELMPVSWEEFGRVHPFAPIAHHRGYNKIISDLEKWLKDITGFDAVSLQPNAGSQGEYAGLLAIQAFHRDNGDDKRNICLIPESAHGTNPASAIMAGLKIIPVKIDSQGSIDIHDLRIKACLHADELSSCMLTYPSTHGLFETTIREICGIMHEFGGLVYIDGANMNAQVGLAKPGEFGADVMHLNLHKTFCIPHGGGGPGVGPICATRYLEPYINHRVSSAIQGSASILPITWMYIRMMGGDGLRKASEVAILSANWLSKKIDNYFKVLYKGKNGRVAHECIFDIRGYDGITAEDVAKRLMDYGFHAPTLSWPVSGTVMVEPTESESLEELERFGEAMNLIRCEIDENPALLKNAPHTAAVCTATEWDYPYTREEAAYPVEQEDKFWAAVSRIDNVYGDRNLVCSCEDYFSESYK